MLKKGHRASVINHFMETYHVGTIREVSTLPDGEKVATINVDRSSDIVHAFFGLDTIRPLTKRLKGI